MNKTKLPLKYVKRSTISRTKKEVPSCLPSNEHRVDFIGLLRRDRGSNISRNEPQDSEVTPVLL